jgi:Zn-dependent protease with chaperone function
LRFDQPWCTAAPHHVDVTWTQFVRQVGQAERALRKLRRLHAIVSLLRLIAFAGLVGLAADLALAPVLLGLALGSVVIGWHAWMAWRHHSRMRHDLPDVMRRLGAQPLDTLGNPLERRLQNLLEELALAAHVGVPRGFVMDQAQAIDGLTLGLDRNNTAVVVTRGALTRLTREELRGLLAHEMAHVVNGDACTVTYTLCLNRGLRWLAAQGWSWHAQPRGHVLQRMLGRACIVLGAPGVAAARLIEAGLPSERDLQADALAVALIGDAHGLGSALRKACAEGMPQGPANAPRAMPMPADWYAMGMLRFSAPSGWADGSASNACLTERIRLLSAEQAMPIAATLEAAPSPALASMSQEPALPVLEVIRAAGGAPRSIHEAAARPRRVWLEGPEPTLLPGDEMAQESASSTAVMRLMRATREPAGAAALAVSLVADSLHGVHASLEQPAWGHAWLVAAQRHGAIRTALAELPEASFQALRWPLLELASGRLRPLSRASRHSLSVLARRQAGGAGDFAPRAWIHCVLLQRRLGLLPAGARSAAFNESMDARSVRVLCAILAQDAGLGEVKADRAANAAIRDLALPPIGGSPGRLSLDALERAVELAACLPAIDRVTLIEHLRRLLPVHADARCAEFLRLLCLTIDCPQVSPPSVQHRAGQLEPSVTSSSADLSQV